MTRKLVIRKPSSLMMNPEPRPPGVRTWTTASPSRLTKSRTLRMGADLLGAEKKPALVAGGALASATAAALAAAAGFVAESSASFLVMLAIRLRVMASAV